MSKVSISLERRFLGARDSSTHAAAAGPSRQWKEDVLTLVRV